jgi:predicted Zn-dependent protease
LRALAVLDSTFHSGLINHARVLIEQRKLDDAIAILERLSHDPNLRSSEELGVLAYAYARAGRLAEARAALARVPRDSLLSSSGEIATALDALGERDAAVATFRRAVAQRTPWLWVYDRGAPYDGLRKDPRLTALFAKIDAAQ